MSSSNSYPPEPYNEPDRYTPGSSPVIKLRPEYQPAPAYQVSDHLHQHQLILVPQQPPAPAPPPYVAPVPTVGYGAPTYAPPAPTYHQPAPPVAYHEPAPPAYHAPVGPVLLDKRPYEVKTMLTTNKHLFPGEVSAAVTDHSGGDLHWVRLPQQALPEPALRRPRGRLRGDRAKTYINFNSKYVSLAGVRKICIHVVVVVLVVCMLYRRW